MQLRPVADESQRMTPHPALLSGVDGDLRDDGRVDPGERDSVPAGTESVGSDGLRPGVRSGGNENIGQGQRLNRPERDRPSDHAQVPD